MIKYLILAVVAYGLWRLWKSMAVRPGRVQQALTLLELPPNADREMVQAAHRRLIARVHPDAGGSAELTRQVNEARDLLLKSLS